MFWEPRIIRIVALISKNSPMLNIVKVHNARVPSLGFVKTNNEYAMRAAVTVIVPAIRIEFNFCLRLKG